jgi:hypothetical protein
MMIFGRQGMVVLCFCSVRVSDFGWLQERGLEFFGLVG